MFDGREERTRSTTFATDLTHAITSDRPVAASRIDALIRAGQELAGHRPLEELFTLILDLAVDSVNGERGVLLTLEGESLVPKAARGENFRISSGVRDRVLEAKESILVNDVQSNEAFRAMHSLVQQQVRMLMAVPLQTKDDVIGLIYVDSPSLTREFSAEDLSLLTVLANVAAIRIEHAELDRGRAEQAYPGEGSGAGCADPAGFASNAGAARFRESSWRATMPPAEPSAAITTTSCHTRMAGSPSLWGTFRAKRCLQHF